MSMTQEDKELLLKDLSARLLYGVKILHQGWNYEWDQELSTLEKVIGIDERFIYTKVINDNGEEYTSSKHTIALFDDKPYLFPMSSMTDEQREEFLNIQSDERQILTDALIRYRQGNFEDKIPTIASYKHIDWLNKNHFDYRDLIEKGLAIDATNLNIYVNLKTINYEDIFRFDNDFERLS